MPAAKKRVVIIGNGKIAKDCANVILSASNLPCELSCVIIDSIRENISEDLKSFCALRAIKFLESGDINSNVAVQYISSFRPDIIFSINNHQIIRDQLLGIPTEGIINFHNGPLPRYGGLNACTWAIFNGEKQHGVTWHYVARGVDQGDIIAQRVFEIRPDATALILVMACISEGISLFKEVLPEIIEGVATRKRQNLTNRLYYYDRMIPEDGFVDFSWDYERIDRLVRSLNYNPLISKLGPAKAAIKGRIFFIDKIKKINDLIRLSPGAVVSITDHLLIQAGDSTLELAEVRNEDGIRLATSQFVENYGIHPGLRLERASYEQ
nr:hypothetical protein [Cytophagales bacterium]